MTRKNTKLILKIAGAIIGIVIIVGYGGFAFRDLLRGPHITITEPTNGETYSTSTIPVKGVASLVQKITLNGQPIVIDEHGNFSEIIVLLPGYNRISLVGEDRLGHITEAYLDLIKK